MESSDAFKRKKDHPRSPYFTVIAECPRDTRYYQQRYIDKGDDQDLRCSKVATAREVERRDQTFCSGSSEYYRLRYINEYGTAKDLACYQKQMDAEKRPATILPDPQPADGGTLPDEYYRYERAIRAYR